MSSFSQWRQSLEKKPQPKQFTWVCGSEQVLVEEVVADIYDKLSPTEWNYALFIAGEDRERQIWNEMDQHPFGNSNRLVVIRSAEKLKNFSRLADFVKHKSSNPRTFVVLVSAEAKLPRLEPTEAEKHERKTSGYLPHIELFTKGRGSLIECRPYTNDTAKHAITWVKDKVPMRDGIAAHLLERANGDLRLVRDSCLKLKALGIDIQLSTVNALLNERPRDDFTDALLRMDKHTAHLALERLSPSEYSRTIGYLDARLDLAGKVHDLMVEKKSASEIAMAVGSQRFLVPEVMEVARYYDTRRRDAIRKVLVIADEALQGGQTIGVMEAITAYW